MRKNLLKNKGSAEARRIVELVGVLQACLIEGRHLAELPPNYRLVPLPMDEPEVAEQALSWAGEAPNPEGWPTVYALFLGGKPLRLVLPGREVALGPPREPKQAGDTPGSGYKPR